MTNHNPYTGFSYRDALDFDRPFSRPTLGHPVVRDLQTGEIREARPGEREGVWVYGWEDEGRPAPSRDVGAFGRLMSCFGWVMHR